METLLVLIRKLKCAFGFAVGPPATSASAPAQDYPHAQAMDLCRITRHVLRHVVIGPLTATTLEQGLRAAGAA